MLLQNYFSNEAAEILYLILHILWQNPKDQKCINSEFCPLLVFILIVFIIFSSSFNVFIAPKVIYFIFQRNKGHKLLKIVGICMRVFAFYLFTVKTMKFDLNNKNITTY